jgi:heat shock protein HslJ
MQRLTPLGLLLLLLFLPGCLLSGGTTWDRINARSWQLVRIEGEPPLQSSAITLELKDTNQLFGESGVNRYFGSYSQDGKSGFHASRIAGTRMAGPAELMDQETRYLKLLERVDAVRLAKESDGQVLQLLLDDREVLAFTPAE